jgi:copper chaperone
MPTIKIQGMSCQHCVMAVTKALAGIEGVTEVRVDLKTGEASYVETKPVDQAVIRERIRKAGYGVV